MNNSYGNIYSRIRCVFIVSVLKCALTLQFAVYI